MKNILIILCFSLTLYGCGNGNSLSKGTLKSALNNYYKQDHPAYIALDSFYCSSTKCSVGKSETNLTPQLDLLVKAGLMTRKEYYEAANANFIGMNLDKSPNTFEYDITDMGKKYFKEVTIGSGMGDIGFAFGENVVVDVNNYTQPADNMGQQMLGVSYTIKVDNIADWAKSDEMRNTFPEIVQAFNSQGNPISQESTMVKTANGWQDVRQSL